MGWFHRLRPGVQTFLVCSGLLGGFLLAAYFDEPPPPPPPIPPAVYDHPEVIDFRGWYTR